VRVPVAERDSSTQVLILCDKSVRLSESTIRGAEIAGRCGAEVHLVGVLESTRSWLRAWGRTVDLAVADDPEEEAKLERALAGAAANLRLDVPVKTWVETGSYAKVMKRLCAGDRYDVIVRSVAGGEPIAPGLSSRNTNPI
jgi:nucleotide-binding universal stress UspA family protein